ncbi:MAG: two-component sensor histidine kinase [Hyphomicrobium zavarzinii]|jgi:two-component system cell cycle sensor histidine kinase PleC|uniref:sensor histidine kinase n=1 Tax=Hyphomicrobium TaxID=81 RepID=UPI00037E0A5D|nr:MULTISPECIES: ATP-binding protein [Hyphomicrobium]MBL8845171.1 two-component sensor histidine kinase [Hyphomicrobium zavarzinii]WBT36306.1 ATP-binding protein [Hyphomicrobium sp. DMF-1]
MDKETRTEILAELRQRHAARKRTDEDVKAARDRLTRGTDIKPEFEFELMSMFARNELSAAVTIWALAAIFSLASMFWAPWKQGCLWLILVITSKVALLELCRRFVAQARPDSDLRVWRRRFILAELFCGLVWAGFALVGMEGQGAAPAAQSAVFSSHVFIFASLIVLLAVRMTFTSTMMSLLYVGTIPMTLAVSARLLMLDEPFYYALATMAVGVHIYFVFLAKGLQQTTLQMLAFRAQKDILIAELDEEKLVSDEARKRAEAGSKAKSRFLATMSHELRTPLNAIMGFSEVMKDELFGEHTTPVYRDYSRDIYDSGRHLLQLINEILDLSRIEAGRYELAEERAHLGDIAEDCQRLLALRASGKGLQVNLNIAPDLSQVWVDVRAMRQICLNLLSNAIKFTPKGGTVTITVAPTPEGGQFLSVRDTGPGIPEDEIPKVLQAFGQGSLAHETAEGGTGLGLPIVKSLIELHDGTFDLRSELRKGTDVCVALPPKRVLATVAPLQPLGAERHRQVAPPPSSRQPRLRMPPKTTTPTPRPPRVA